jgi:hypothetical protein
MSLRKGGANFRTRPSIGVMASVTASAASSITKRRSAQILDEYGRGGEQGNLLRSQLSRRFSGLPEEEIEEAVQTACRRFEVLYQLSYASVMAPRAMYQDQRLLAVPQFSSALCDRDQGRQQRSRN